MLKLSYTYTRNDSISSNDVQLVVRKSRVLVYPYTIYGIYYMAITFQAGSHVYMFGMTAAGFTVQFH